MTAEIFVIEMQTRSGLGICDLVRSDLVADPLVVGSCMGSNLESCYSTTVQAKSIKVVERHIQYCDGGDWPPCAWAILGLSQGLGLGSSGLVVCAPRASPWVHWVLFLFFVFICLCCLVYLRLRRVISLYISFIGQVELRVSVCTQSALIALGRQRV